MVRAVTLLSSSLIVSLGFAGDARAQTDTATVATATTATAAPGLDRAEAEAFDAFFDPESNRGLPFRESARFIEAVEIVGNDKTTRGTITRRLSVDVGDLLNEERIEESRLRLLGTGFFESVEFSLRRGSQRGRVILVLEVTERNTILIDELYLGSSRVAPFFGGLGVAETNFLGRGVTVSGAFVVGRNRRTLNLGVFVPSLSGTALQLSASAILLQGAELLNVDDPDGEELTYERLGGTLGFGVGIGPSQRISLIYRLESVQADRLPNLDPAILRQAPSIQFDDSVLSTLSAAYERDTRDDPFVPTSGTRVALAVEVGSSLLGSSYEFSKYTGEAQLALSPFSDHSLVLRIFGGMIQGQAPFFNQFFFSDFAYFAWNRDSLPRNAQLNFSESNDYDDLILSGGAKYSVPLVTGRDLLYRMYVYTGIDSTVTASLDELQEDPTGRGTGGTVPLSFDLGLEFDTWIGNFTLSLSYIIDLVL